MLCPSCDANIINGVKCHEHGCPDSWKDTEIECVWCGTLFKPDQKGQNVCSGSCANAYYGLDFN